MEKPRPLHFMALTVVFVLVAGLLLAGCGLSASTTASTTSVSPTMATTTTTLTTTSETAAASSTSTSKATSTTKKATTTTRSPVAGKEFDVLPTEDKVIALTFDAAYEVAPLAGMLQALKDARAVGTFFLTGEFVEDFPEGVAAIKKAGFAIGSHSYSHPDFVGLDDDQIRSQLKKTESLLAKAGVADPRPLFRFPYGSRDDRTLALVGKEGYVSFFWTIDTLDWETERTTEQIRKVILDKLQPGAIVLMHVSSPQTAAVLPQILQDLKERGYRTIGLREALEKYGS